MNNAYSRLQPGPQPGTFYVNGMLQRIVDWTHRPVWDTFQLTAGAGVAAGQEELIFRDIQAKDRRLTNLSQSSQMPSDWELIVLCIMIQIRPATAYASLNREELYGDFYALLRSGYFELTVGNTTLVTQGRLDFYPCPYGMFLQVDSDQAPAAEDLDNVWISVNNGSPHGQPRPLLFPVHVTKSLTFEGMLRFETAETIENAWDITVILDSLVKRPVK